MPDSGDLDPYRIHRLVLVSGMLGFWLNNKPAIVEAARSANEVRTLGLMTLFALDRCHR